MQLEKELISWKVKLRNYSSSKEMDSFKEKFKEMGRRKEEGLAIQVSHLVEEEGVIAKQVARVLST